MGATTKLELVDAPAVDLVVRVQGVDVGHFEGNGDTELDTMVDNPLDTFEQAVRLGMLGEGTLAGLSSELDLKAQSQTWRCRAEGVDPGALRVLVNMLAARDLASVDVVAVALAGAPPAPVVDVRSARYPAPPAPLGFVVERIPPLRGSKDRVVQLVFAEPLEIGVAREVCEALEVWDRLLSWGGYPVPGEPPDRTGAMAEPAFQLDAWTVEQSFPELFLCDEASFDAVVGYARRLHRRGAMVDRVRVG
jgi:hypothetical protein